MQIISTWSDYDYCLLSDQDGRREGDRIIARIRGNWWLCVRLSVVSENKVSNINTQLPFLVADTLYNSDKNSKIHTILTNKIIFK